jgi:hypothetical protein
MSLQQYTYPYPSGSHCEETLSVSAQAKALKAIW